MFLVQRLLQISIRILLPLILCVCLYCLLLWAVLTFFSKRAFLKMSLLVGSQCCCKEQAVRVRYSQVTIWYRQTGENHFGSVPLHQMFCERKSACSLMKWWMNIFATLTISPLRVTRTRIFSSEVARDSILVLWSLSHLSCLTSLVHLRLFFFFYKEKYKVKSKINSGGKSHIGLRSASVTRYGDVL